MHNKRRIRRRGLDRGYVLAHGKRRVANDGVRRGRPRPPRLHALAVDLADVIDVGAAAVLAPKLDRGRALLARVADRIAHHPDVGLAVVGHRQLEPFRLGQAIAVEQRLAELVLDVEVRGRREDEVRHLVALEPERVDDAHRRVDVALGRPHHADDLQVGPELTALAAAEDEAQRLPFAFRDGWKADVHDVNADVGQHPRELVLVLRRDRDAWHLLAVAQRVVVDPDLLRRGELEVMRETRRVASQLVEWLLQLYGLEVIFTSPLAGKVAAKPRLGPIGWHLFFGAAPRAACAPRARALPCATARS